MLAVGFIAGYGAGIIPDRDGTGRWRGNGMTRSGDQEGYMIQKNDDNRGIAKRDGSGWNHESGQGRGMMGGRQGTGQGGGMMGDCMADWF